MAKLSYPKTNDEKAKLYLHAMVEVKERLQNVVTILNLPLAPLFIQEMCYLQFRYICELIAIACLAAQGDYETQRSFTESYKPPEIFKQLRKLYPDFFPESAARTVSDNDGGGRLHHVDFAHKANAYTESDVTSLWKTSGGHLHRASVQKYLKTTFGNKPPQMKPLLRHLEGLATLLDSHIIPIQKNPDDDLRLLIEMGVPDEPIRMMFLHINHANNTIAVESYEAQLTR